jgi:rubrerythrin
VFCSPEEALMGLPIDFSKLDVQDILDIGVLIEKEAKETYEEFAARMRRANNPSAASLFTKLAGWEALHGHRLAERRQQLFGNAPSRYRDVVPWNVETPPGERVSETMTLREAVELGLETETMAGDYYAAALEQLTDASVSDLLAFLRDAELEHKRLLTEQLAQAG